LEHPLSRKVAARHGTEHSAAPGGTRPPAWALRQLERTLRLIDTGPRPFYRAALGSVAVTSALAMTIAFSTRPAGPLSGPQRDMVVAALVALCLSAALWGVSLALRGRTRPPGWLDWIVGPADRAAIWLAIAGWVPFLLIVVYLRAAATFPPAVRWLNYGYDDKRWISAIYLLGTLGPLIALITAARVLAVGRSHPPSWRTWLAWLFPRTVAHAPDPPDPSDPPGSMDAGTGEAVTAQTASSEAGPSGWRHSRVGRILTVAAGLATALALAWYFLGPPWYLSRNGSAIGQQEDIFLTGFQAIANGHLPYIGVAGVQYGPGTQFASYLLMRHVTSFSVVGFRQAWALLTWAGASVLFGVFFLAFGYVRGLAASLLSALVYPALGEIAFQSGGSFDGFWGWANPLRYVGMIALVLLLPGVVRRSPSWRGAAAGGAIGVLWGVTSYLGQENLIAGAAGALIVGALLLVTGTSSWRAVRWALGAALAGFVVIWAPILAFYAAHRDLGHFLSLYFLLARAMAQGFGNTSWQGSSHQPSPLTTMFYALPFLLAVIALLVAFQVRPVRVAAPWSQERTRLVVMLIVMILLYQGALLRSDTVDLTGTMLALPGLVVMTASALPRMLGARRRVTLTVAGAALTVASFALLPYQAFAWTSLRSAAEAPYLDRERLGAEPPPGRPATLAASRVGAGLDGAPLCCEFSSAPMTALIPLMNRIHAIVGDRTAYVADFPHALPGLVYFLADLTPAPVMADKYMTILNEPQLTAYMAYFQASVLPDTQAVLTADPATPEARYFLQRYAGARRVTLDYDGKPYYVLLRS
jgi:hypothetical protein